MRNSKVIIIRGLPGSGKSTLARKLSADTGIMHLELDMFWVCGGQYVVDGRTAEFPKRIALLDNMLFNLMDHRVDVILTGVFPTVDSVCKIHDMSFRYNDVYVVRCDGRFKGTHPVPSDVLERMSIKFTIHRHDIIYTGQEGHYPTIKNMLGL